jgi:uncharacterized protein YegL
MWKKTILTVAVITFATSIASAAPKGAAAGWTPPGLANKGDGFTPPGLANQGKTPKGWGPRAEETTTETETTETETTSTPTADQVTEEVTGLPVTTE